MKLRSDDISSKILNIYQFTRTPGLLPVRFLRNDVNNNKLANFDQNYKNYEEKIRKSEL